MSRSWFAGRRWEWNYKRSRRPNHQACEAVARREGPAGFAVRFSPLLLQTGYGTAYRMAGLVAFGFSISGATDFPAGLSA